MAVGLGIVLLILGLVLALGVVNADLGFVDEGALGWILALGGVLAIVLSLLVNQQRSRSKHVRRRHQGRPR